MDRDGKNLEIAASIFFVPFIQIDDFKGSDFSLNNDWYKEKFCHQDKDYYRELINYETPHHILEKKEFFNSLSKEAKAVISLILDSPSEIINNVGKITKHLIVAKLKKDGWRHSTVDKTFKELKAKFSH